MITNSVLVHAHNREVSGPYRASLVRLENAGKAVFHNTLFVNRARAAISFGGEQNEITLKNCFTVSRTALLPKQGTANQVSISANQCSFHARETTLLAATIALVSCGARSSTVHCIHGLRRDEPSRTTSLRRS